MAKKSKVNELIYVKVASLVDLARQACNFDYTSSTVVSIKKKEVHTLMVLGESVDDCTIAYYVNAPREEKLIKYTPPAMGGELESASFTTEMGTQPNNYISIIEIDGRNLKEATKKKEVQATEVKNTEEFIIATIKKGVSHETIASIYSFSTKNGRILCAFDIIEELSDGPRTLYYSKVSDSHGASFARYKYNDNKVDFTAYMGEHSYMYAKIINLAEPFPFFKMPD